MSSNVDNGKEAVASRKLAAAEMRKARKEARDTRNRLFSDSSYEVPKGILKNSRIPTKRSVSECVDDLSLIMADLDLNIHDFPKATSKICPHHNYFNKVNEDEEYDDYENRKNEYGDDDNYDRNLNNCDCNSRYGDNDNNEKPKKSVRFDERVYETFFVASRLYDRRYFAKYHFSSRHHPPTNQQNNKSKKNRQNSSKSEIKEEPCGGSLTNLKMDSGCKLSKSQRAKQSKKDRRKRLNKRDDGADTSSDDQGYCSSFHSFSD